MSLELPRITVSPSTLDNSPNNATPAPTPCSSPDINQERRKSLSHVQDIFKKNVPSHIRTLSGEQK